jgi:cytochrome c biogenesis protein CcmG/thiol:disulfide interchange protein DsbE
MRENRNDLPSARAGHAAPAVALEQMGDRPLFTDDMLRSGEVTLVNFWASWCPPCRAEHPLVSELAEEGMTVLGVNYRDTPDRATEFLEDLGDPFAALGADPRARMGLDWGVVGLPETFVVDGDGNIVMRHAGPLTEEVIEERLRPAIERARQG